MITTRTKPNNSTLRFTQRDENILATLSRFRFLSISQLALLFFPSKGAAEGRLRQLHQHGLVVRVFMPVRPYDRRSTTIYALGAAGAQLLPPRTDGSRPKGLTPREQRSGLFLDHTLRRNDVWMCLHRLEAILPHFRLVSWLHAPEEIRASAIIQQARHESRVPIVADAWCTVAIGNTLYGFAIEIDMGTVRTVHMRERYAAYWTWWKEGQPTRRFGPIPFRVLTLTTTSARLRALQDAAQHAPGHGRKGSGLFWFAHLDQADILEPAKLLGPVWSVARAQPVYLQPLFPARAPG